MKQQMPKVVRDVENQITSRRDSVFERFPLLFTLLGTFGVATTLYGVEGLINKVHFLSNNPVIAFATGLLVLVFTGTLYKKL